MNGLQPGHQPERTAVAGTSVQLPRNLSAAAQMDEAADDSQHVTGVPSMVGVPVHSKDPDSRRAFHYQYSVASAWWQRWHQWYAKTYIGGALPPQPYEELPGKPGQPHMMPPVQMGLPAMVGHPPVTGSDDGGSMHTAPMPLSDGCTNDDGLQPHSTVSSDAGKSSLLKGGEHKVCKNCGTDCTPFWRKDKNDQLPLCNACGLYATKNGSMRPASLWRQEEGLSPLPRPPNDDVTMDVRPQGAFPTSAPLPSLHPSDPTSVPSEALSDPVHPTTSTDRAGAAPKPAEDGAKASSSPEPVATLAADTTQPASAVPAPEQPTPATDLATKTSSAPAAPTPTSGATAPIAVPSGPPAHASDSSIAPAAATAPAGPVVSERSGLPPLNQPSTESQTTDDTKPVVSQSAPQPSAMQVVPTPGLSTRPAPAGHPVPDAPAMPPMPGAMVPPTNSAVRVPTPSTQATPPSCFANQEDCMQLPSAAELLSGGMRPHSAAMLPTGPTLMPSPLVAPYNARFVQLGTIGHGPQQYPIVQFAGGAMPQFRPQRTRSDAQSTLPPLPPLAKSAPPPNNQPPGSFVAMPRTGGSVQQRTKRTLRVTKSKRAATQAQAPALSDSSPMVASPVLSPRCTDMGGVSEEPFVDDEALGDADEAAFDPAELEALFNDDTPIPLDLREGDSESNVFGGDASSLGDLDCVVPFPNEGGAARAHSAPDPFGFP